MKKFTAIVLLLATLLSLAACGGKAPAPETPENPTTPEVSDMPDEPETPAEPEVPAEPEAPVEPEPVLPGAGYTAPGQEKEIKNILLLANSFGNRFVDELHDIFAAGGYEVNVCNIYRAGCTAPQHWANLTNMAENTEVNNYSYFVTNKDGRNKLTEITTIQQALAYADWDLIVFQHHFDPSMCANGQVAYNSCANAAKNMFDYLKENFPKATLMWYETWAFEVGYAKVRKEKDQIKMYNSIHEASLRICEENGVAMLPCGTAWQIARANPAVGDTLCLEDKCHDGDVQGGQFLNASVYYEVLFGKSCLENTFRPSYELDEAKAVELQKAAHEAVASYYGEDYAK